jgi:hypothetical protein
MPFNQPLAGLVEPAARSWKSAKAADRKALYEFAGELAVKEKRKELARAVGANGRRMRPRKHPRPDGANGPVMTPHDEASRTGRLLAFRAWAGGITLFWHAGLSRGQRKAWGTILGYHAAGKVRGAPRRDVRLSKRGIGAVAAAVRKWWTARLRAATRREKARAVAAAQKPAPLARLGRAASGAVAALAKAAGKLKPNIKKAR